MAGDGVAGGDEAEAAAAKGEEGVAAEAGGGGCPAGFGEGAFVGREDGAGGVSFACVQSEMSELELGDWVIGRTYCATWWWWWLREVLAEMECR